MIRLTRYELVIAALYANGATVRQITGILNLQGKYAAMGAIKSVREKFSFVGVDAGTKLLFADAMNAEPRGWFVGRAAA